MSRDPLTRMDVDTRWPYHRKCRALQAAHPTDWPAYWCAYLALLGETWTAQARVTLAAAWVPSLPVRLMDAQAALEAAGLIDKSGRLPSGSFKEWVEPAIARVRAKSEGGRKGAQSRWNKRTSKHETTASTQSHSDGYATPTQWHDDAPRQPRQPTTPATPTNGRALDDETARYGLPHITAEVAQAAERATGHGITTLTGSWATELDRLVEDRGADRVAVTIVRAAESFPEKPSWAQLVAKVRNLLEPLPGAERAAPADPASERDAFVARMQREATRAS